MKEATTQRRHVGVFAFAAALIATLALALTPLANARAADDSAPLTAGTQALQETLETQGDVSIIPGVYHIQTSLSGTYMLDLYGASKKDGANVQIYQWNSTDAQRWNISKNSDGTYTIKNMSSGKVLDVAGAIMADGTNVQQYKSNSSAAQKWTFEKNGTGYVIKSAVNSKYVLDVYGGIAKNESNVQIHKANGSDAQKWWLVPDSPSVKSKKVLPNGTYELRLASAPSYTIDSADDTLVNGTNVELNKRDSSISQRWYLRWNSKGYYTIHNVSTGKVLDVQDDSPAARANVQSWSTNGTAAQHWAISKNDDGSYAIKCIATGHCLDIAGAKADNGTNVRMMPSSSAASQRISIKRCTSILPGDSYVIYSMLAPLKSAIAIPDGSLKTGEQAQLVSASGSLSEHLYLRRVSGNTFTIQAACSGKYLTDSTGNVVQKKGTGKKAQQWTVSVDGGGLAFTNVATGKRLAVSGSKAINGTPMVTAAKKSKNAQRFHLVSTLLIPDGYYEVSNAAALSHCLDVAGAATTDRANVQLYKKNGTAAQAWKFSYVSDGYYKIVNDGSGKALDVANGSKDAGANVWQFTVNNSDAQMWRPVLSKDGSISFVNKGSSMALEAAGKDNFANVRQAAKLNKQAQGWYLTETISRALSGNAELDGYLRKVANDNGGDFKKCFNWLKSNVSRVDSVSTTTPATGIIGKQTTIDEALYVFRNKKADSYYYASALKWLAVACGYSADARSGQVTLPAGTKVPHGWTEVTSNGQSYVCDVDLAIRIGGTYKWYMVDYNSAAVQYHL